MMLHRLFTPGCIMKILAVKLEKEHDRNSFIKSKRLVFSLIRRTQIRRKPNEIFWRRRLIKENLLLKMNGRYKKLWQESILNRFIRDLIKSCLMRSLRWLKAALRFRLAMFREARWFQWIRIPIIHRFGWIRVRIIHRFCYKIIFREVHCHWIRA
jgi:hypothetical protein